MNCLLHSKEMIVAIRVNHDGYDWVKYCDQCKEVVKMSEEEVALHKVRHEKTKH